VADRLHTDRELQDAYRARMAATAHGNHVSDATWERIISGEIDQHDREAAFDHVVQCALCSQKWKSISELTSAAAAEGLIAPAAATPSSSWRSRYLPLAVAATLVVAVAGVMLTRQPPPQPETMRSTSEVPPIEGLMMAYDPAGVPTLVWPPVTRATRYRVEIFSEDGRPVWSAEVASPPARWPETTPRVKGAYRWRVDALDRDSVIARSRLMPMEIR